MIENKIQVLLYSIIHVTPARTGVLLSSGITLSINNRTLTSKCHLYKGGGKAIILKMDAQYEKIPVKQTLHNSRN